MNDELNYKVTGLTQHAKGSITYGVPVAAAKASGAITFGTPVDGDTIIVNGTTMTKVAADPAANEFVDIAGLETLIEALDGINSSQDGTTITIEAATAGPDGNAITLALGEDNTGDMAISGATLTGGANSDTVIVNGETLTCVAANPSAGEFSSIAELEALIEALTGINSEVAGGVINIVAAAVGVAGNEITLALGEGNTGTMAISGATLTGGIDATYTDAIEFTGGMNPEQVDAVIDIDALTASGTAVITPQVSMDKENWIDRTPSDTLAAVGVTELHTSEPLAFMRYKIVLGGPAPTASLKINARKSA
ncbi:MAG: hypothetical protein EOM62_12590 [Bacteroidia bacterium]|nr:hypothetical protein [Bacteroidia bacterium]